jgi:hypothetical protein
VSIAWPWHGLPRGNQDAFSIFRAVDFELSLPSLRSSLKMRRAPHPGLLVFIFITRFRALSLVTGRPRDFWRNVRLRAASFRCHGRTVFGNIVTIFPTTFNAVYQRDKKQSFCLMLRIIGRYVAKFLLGKLIVLLDCLSLDCKYLEKDFGKNQKIGF